MPPTNDDDDVESILEPHQRSLAYDLKQSVPLEVAARDLVDRSNRLDELKLALKRPEESVEIAERTGNLTITNSDGRNLLVLSPEDASSLASTLSVKAHEAVNTEENDG